MDKTYIIYTAGQMAVTIKRYAQALGIKIEAFYDNDKERWGTKVDGLEVYSKEKLNDFLLFTDMSGIIIGSQIYETEILDEIECRFGRDVYVIKFNEIHKRYWNEIALPYRKKLKNKYDIMFNKQAECWINNIMSEVEYWVRNAKKQMQPNSNRYNRYLKEFRCDRLNGKVKSGDIVIDAGSGICSKYGNIVAGGEIKLVAVDPLAYFYNKINEKIGTNNEKNLVVFGLFEFLSLFLGNNYADIILIDNALDHCIDPFKSVVECLSVIKQGGILSMHHRRAEAVYEGYSGLHKWNIDVNEDNDFIIWNESNMKNISQDLKEYADIEVVLHVDELRFKEYVDINIVKKTDFLIENFYNLKEENKKLAQLINAFMQNFSEEKNNAYFQKLLREI